jgi:hypothetical protein
MDAKKDKKLKSSKKNQDEDVEAEEKQGGDGAMITAICWVGRGYAKPSLDEDETM